ncbi:MAG: archaeosortase H N-terminal-like domain-containing protein [Promethearchaeota archaeon]|jgi:phage-related holin
MNQILLKKLLIWVLVTINLLFAFIIGLSIPQLETPNSYIFGYVMIPLLIILNYIIIDRFYYLISQLNDRKENIDVKE